MVLVRFFRSRMPIFKGQSNSRLMRSSFIVGWSGARGPISALAAFSIPLVVESGEPFPFRDVVVATTFGVIVVTLLLAQTIGPLARRLKVQEIDGSQTARRLDAALAYAALKELDEAEEAADLTGQPIPREVIEGLRIETQRRVDALAPLSEEAVDQPDAVTAGDLLRLMVRAEQEELLRIRDEEGLPDSIVRPVQLALDMRHQALGPKKTGT
jgi:CPA1 family monovalent cation:H+ antiporter